MVFEKLRRNKSDPARPSAKMPRYPNRETLKPNDMPRRNTAAMTVLTDDVEDVFYGRTPAETSTSQRSTERTTERDRRTDNFQYRVTGGVVTTHSPPSTSSSGNELFQMDACDARAVRSELADLKDELEAVRKEMLTELQTTRYDMLKEMAMLKGALLQLTNTLATASTGALPVISEDATTPHALPAQQVEAISRRLTTQTSRATKERLTTTHESQVPPAMRLSSRPTQLMPVNDNALSTPLRQQQIDEMFPLIDAAADISVQARILEPGTRDWVFERMQQWLDSRFEVGKDTVLAMVGDAGVGKSVAASAVCTKHGEQVAATHFCKFDRKAKSTPRNVLLSLVNQLTSSLPGFKAQLARLNLRYVLEEKDVVALARRVLVDPLKAVEEPLTAMFIVLDGIDQCRTMHGNDLLDFLSIVLKECPTWLGFVITSKPSPEFAASLPITSVLDFSSNNQKYMEDAAFLINDALSALPGTDLAEARRVLKRKSAGNFSYLEFARHALSQSSLENSRGLVPVDILDDLPESLYEIYEEIFEDKFGQGMSRLWRKVQPVLNFVVSAASGPFTCISERQIADWLSYSKDDLLLVRRSFSDIISVRQGVYYIMSSAIYDWLSDPARSSEQFYVDIETGIKTLRQAARGELSKQESTRKPPTSRQTSNLSIISSRSSSSSMGEGSPRSEEDSVTSRSGKYEPNRNAQAPVGILKRRDLM